jgi:hypothetical protein
MIAFLTLLLGLASGVQQIDLSVSGAVSRVDLVLDGRTVQSLSAPPWTAACDLGSDLAPHRLVAIARDRKGEEIARAEQDINLPRPSAEAHILLEKGPRGRVESARISWQSLTRAQPSEVSVAFDGKPLAVADPHEISLPRFNPETVHFLTVDLEFSAAEKAHAEAIFGGSYQGEAETELTAIPIESDSSRPPAVSDLSRWLEVDGKAASVVGVEKGEGIALIVRQREADQVMAQFHPSAARLPDASGAGGPTSFGPPLTSQGEHVPQFSAALGRSDTLRFLWASPGRSQAMRVPADLFPASRDFSSGEGGVASLLTSLVFSTSDSGPERLSDAVAVASLQAAYGNRRRAVVLLAAEASDGEANEYPVSQVRAYMRDLHVPFKVWAATRDGAADLSHLWGPAEPVTSLQELEQAVRDLRKTLDRQWIVWIAGRHLPQDIALSADARGVTIAE